MIIAKTPIHQNNLHRVFYRLESFGPSVHSNIAAVVYIQRILLEKQPGARQVAAVEKEMVFECLTILFEKETSFWQHQQLVELDIGPLI